MIPAGCETPRLRLRAFTEADVAAMHAYRRLPEVTRFLYGEPDTEEDTRRRLARKMGRPHRLEADGDAIGYALELRATGELVGDVNLNLTSAEHQQGEIGYVLHPGHWGHGYATEGCRPLLHVAFAELDLHRVCGRLDARNTGSAAVLERLGLRREALLVENERVKGEWTTEAVYAILAEEWRTA